MEWYIIIIISAIFAFISDITKKRVLIREHTAEFTTSFFILITIFLLPFIYKLNLSIPINIFSLIIIKGIILATALLLFNKALRHSDISLIMPLKNLSPLFLLVLAYFFLGERISLIQGVGVFIVIIGGYFLESTKFRITKILRNKYIYYIMFSLILTSISASLDKVIIKHTNIYTILFMSFLVMSIILLTIQFTVYGGFKDIKYSLKKGKIPLFISVITLLLSDVSYFAAVAIPTTFISLIIPLRRVSTFLDALIGGKIFHEKYVLRRSIACILMVAGIYLIIV